MTRARSDTLAATPDDDPPRSGPADERETSPAATEIPEAVLRTLEFDRIRELVQDLALTPLGAAALASLRPRTAKADVQAALDATGECARYVDENAPFALVASPELPAALKQLAVAGQPLDPQHLTALADFLASTGAVRNAVERAGGGPYPFLQAAVEGCQAFTSEVEAIRAAIDPGTGIVDDASAKLKSLRAGVRRQQARLRGTLESYVRGKDTARYLQAPVVSERNGRLVLLVKAAQREAIPGIVHGRSGTGASLFLEPLSTVEINNAIVSLKQDAAAEERRLLLALADALRRRRQDVQAAVEAATAIDVAQARAGAAQLMDGVQPVLTGGGGLDLAQARHPLLIPAVQHRLGAAVETGAQGPVPVDLRVVPPRTAIVVTGPNTGGKTVALKTAGLLALMVQAGLHIPVAAGSRTTVFRSVFADIGDAQSLAANVSTFSGAIANIAAMATDLVTPGLVLLDEVGAATDPAEGSALGAAIIEYFRQQGAIVLATTHADPLKAYAVTTDGVDCASFGYDADTWAPTYRLSYGSRGRSLALAIAARLGLESAIIDDARGRLGRRDAERDAERAELDEDRRRLGAERQRLQADRADLEARAERLEARETRLRDMFEVRVDALVTKARAEIDAVIQDLGGSARRRGRSPGKEEAAAPPGRRRASALAAVGAAVDRARTAAAPSAAAEHRKPAATPPAVGVVVRVRPLGVVGRVLALHAQQAEVDVRGKRLRVAVGDLHVERPDQGPAAPAADGQVTVACAPLETNLPDLNLIGCTADDAGDRVEQYLDRAVLHAQRRVRIVHGYGTGRLRRAVADLLGRHPLVSRFSAAPAEQGGGGATLVELKE